MNWSGTYTINTMGTNVTSATNTTMTSAGAVWPTGGQSLANFTVRILSGTGSGQTRVITSNTSTVLTVPTWSVNPDNTSTYEIVLIFKNSDHVTAALTLSTNVITELEDSATILVDGNYIILLDTSSVVRWNKSETTLVTFEANSRSTQGKAGFWNYIGVPSTKTVSAPNISYIKTRDCTHALFLQPSTILDNATTIHHIWSEDTSSSMAYMTGAAAVVNMRLSNFYNKGSTGSSLNYSATNNTFTQIFERMWGEWGLSGGPLWSNATNNLSWVRDSVFIYNAANHAVDVASGKEFRVNNCYCRGNGGPGMVFLSSSSVAAAGTYRGFHNVFQQGRAFAGAAAASTSSLLMSSNDLTATQTCSLGAIDISQANAYTTATSNFDYIAGNLGAALENIDTTTSTTSTASPVQYKNLTANRTNARSTVNFPLVADNVVAGTPTGDSVAVTFDCQNGAISGQTTTVNGDSNSGQAVVNVASSTYYMPGMMIEIGYGTARSETGRVLSTAAGTITLDANLTFTHTAAQGDTVAPRLRNQGLPFIRYGTSTGNYNMQTDIPDEDNWGLIYTGIKLTFDGRIYAWNQTGHSVTIADLEAETLYYAQACFYTPLRGVGVSTEFTFTTATSVRYTDPGVANVRLGTAYQYASLTNNRTGTVRVPSVGQVQIGVVYDASDSLTGTYNGSDRWTDPGIANVRAPVAYKANSTTNNMTGNVDVPSAANVKIGVAFDTNDTLTGTYDGHERYTDVPTADVLNGFPYAYNSLTNNRTGTLATSDAAAVAAAVWATNLSGYNTINTAGNMVKMTLGKVRNIISMLWAM